jgi:hypothetical protein
MDRHDETPLTGGRVTKGVVRIGDTVRRPISTSRLLQHDLLRHLETKGFGPAPSFLGIDAQGREILSYMEGSVPTDLGHFTDLQLAAAARLLRRFHDATVDFGPVADANAEVLCHNDFGPPNAVFRDGVPYALIDFDTIAPGSRIWDIGYSALSWLDLGNTDYSGDEQCRRLTVFFESYDLPGCKAIDIADSAIKRAKELSARAKREGNMALAGWAASVADWTASNLPASCSGRSRL